MVQIEEALGGSATVKRYNCELDAINDYEGLDIDRSQKS